MKIGERRKKPVIVELEGRLGNQLFQFAAGYSISSLRDAPLRFCADRVDASDLLLPALIDDLYVEASRIDLLSVGKLAYRLRPLSLWNAVAAHALRVARRVRGMTPAVARYKEQTGVFHSSVFNLDLPLYLQGHFESERYFEHCCGAVADAINWPNQYQRELEAGPSTVGVTFRRGDFNSLGRALPLRYYDDAIRLVAERMGEVKLLLFGDDIGFVELASSWLDRYGEVVNVLETLRDPVDQLALLSTCEHVVMANSSFARWGAWLGDQRKRYDSRVVVAPSEYCGGDRLPARWHQIPAGITYRTA